MVVPTRLLQAKVDVPPVVEVPQGAKTVEVRVRTELANPGELDVVLHAPTEDETVFWHVLDERHREILREKPPKRGEKRKGVEEFRSLTVAGGHSEHETETLTLAAGKLKHGRTYVVRAEVWGQIAEAEFVAIHTAPMAALRPAAAPAKRAAAGKAAPKKAVPKAAAPKRTGAGKAAPAKRAAPKKAGTEKAQKGSEKAKKKSGRKKGKR